MKILIFVYGTDSGLYSSLKHGFGKLVTGNGKRCKLYSLTYGRIFMKRVWRDFLGSLSYHKVFFGKKDFKKAHPEFEYLELPAILLKSGDKISVLMTAEEIGRLEDIDDLIGQLGNKLI